VLPGLTLSGEVDTSPLAQRLYSQDASIYQQRPLGVAYPRNEQDLIRLVTWSNTHRTAIIPRAGGTSLAGQCVGSGLVVDVSRYMTRVVAVDAAARTARVEPGVVRDDLNDLVASHGLTFAPDTSTSRQAGIGGMIGNNSCGAYSVLHGTTRDHVLEIDAVLSDGSLAVFRPLSAPELEAKQALDTLEGRIYRDVVAMVDRHRDLILAHYPRPTVTRRNMGYALDVLARSQPWNPEGPPFSLIPLLCGSEGTLCLISGALLRLVPLPAARTLLCAHFGTVKEACAATSLVLRHRPAAVELMDGLLLEATRNHRSSQAWRFWVEGTPGGVLAIELHADKPGEDLTHRVSALIDDLRAHGMGYAYPVIEPARIASVWALRKAGLGLLTGIPGDIKPVTAIEDTAVDPVDLPAYLEDIQALMKRHGLEVAVYGHASVGLLHLRPMLNLKDAADRETFTTILQETATLVAKYGGSLSGEHGDGRLRGPFIRTMLSDDVYRLLEEVKRVFDPEHLLNPGVIVDPPPVTEAWRTPPCSRTPEIRTEFDWSRKAGFVRAVEACNGVGLCRQSAGREAVMCPSYMATREEGFTPRGRANVLRQLLTAEDPDAAWTDPGLAKVLDTCISCKGCAAECPSSVDVARFKAEVLQKAHDRRRPDVRSRLFGFFTRGARLARIAPRTASWMINLAPVKRGLGIAPERRMPTFARRTFSHWFNRHVPCPTADRGVVALLNDEFTEYLEPHIGRCAVESLEKLGYRVVLIHGLESGRGQISKGFLRAARRCMERAVEIMDTPRYAEVPLIGLEPSALLGFRDEAPDLVSPALRPAAERAAARCLLFEEFVMQGMRAETTPAPLHPLPQPDILLHGHCHQKALAGQQPTVDLMKRIPGSRVTVIPSGCCGMAGSFGYEVEHYALSMQIGELVLFPAVRAMPDALVCANGSRCRQQILAGTGRIALHPAEILHAAL